MAVRWYVFEMNTADSTDLAAVASNHPDVRRDEIVWLVLAHGHETRLVVGHWHRYSRTFTR
jgi:hypothetical protein